MALPVTYPVRKDILDAHQQTWPEDAPSSGPYRITSHKINSLIRLERNPNYWGERAKVPTVNLKVVTDESTAVNAFSAGQLDILVRVGNLDFPRLKKQGVIQSTPFLATYYIGFNCLKPPFNDVNLRRAVASAIHKEEITEALGSGEIPASSWIPKGLEGYFPFQKSGPYLGPKGKALFSKPFEIAFDESFRNTRIFEIIQQNLKNELSAEVTLAHMDWKNYVQRLQSDPPPIYRLGWMAPVVDPISHLRVFLKGERNNYTGCSSPKYDLLVQEIEKLHPGPERLKKIAEAQKVILDELVAVVPIYHYVQNTAVAKRVEGFAINLFGVIPFHKISLK